MSASPQHMARQWMRKAENDLKIGQDELQTREPVTDMVCYHMQQCVEKYLKAYLVLHEKPFRRTHDLAELIELCRELDPSFEQFYAQNVDSLTVYGTEVRYPDNFYMPSLEEAEESLRLALLAREFVRARLKERGVVDSCPTTSSTTATT